VGLKVALVALFASLLLRHALQEKVPPELAVPVLALCLLASQDSWLVRPQLWTFFFSILFLQFLYDGRERGWKNWLWLAPLMLLWANLHAGCVFGFALGGAFAFGEVIRCWRGMNSFRSWGILVACLGGAFAASFVNPYGYRIPLGVLVSHLDQTQVAGGRASVTMLGNMEWLPPTFSQEPLFYLVMLFWLTLLLLRWRRIDPVEGIMFLGFCYMGFSQIRHSTLVSLLAGFFLPVAITQLAKDFWPGCLSRPTVRRVLLALSLALIFVLPLKSAQAGRLGWGLKNNIYPVSAADFIDTQRPPGNLYNAYDWGGYLMWRLFPDYLVYVDGRSDSPEFFEASTRIENGLAGWREDLDRHGVGTIVTRTCFYDSGGPQALIDNLVRSPDWTLVFQDEVAVVFVRNDAGTLQLRGRFGMPSRFAYRTMLAEARRLQQESGPRPRSWLAIGRAAFGLGHARTALAAYRRYLAHDPGNAEAQARIAFLQRLAGNAGRGDQ